MKVITGKEKHIDNCIQIARSLSDYFTEKAIDQIQKDLHSNLFYVTLKSNDVAGFLVISLKSGEIAEILWMGVKKDEQNQGHGYALLNHVVDNLKSKGIKLLAVKTLSADTDYSAYKKTEEFYKRNGFILLEVIDPYPNWEPGNPCALYVKIL